MNTNVNLFRYSLCVCATAPFLLFSLVASAAESTPFQMGAFETRIGLDASLSYDDNVFRDSELEQDSTVFNLAPSIDFISETQTRSIGFGASIDYSEYLESGVDSLLNNTLYVKGDHDVAKHSGIHWGLDLLQGNEQRGTGATEGNQNADINEATEFTRFSGSLGYSYGDERSKSYFNIDGSYADTSYDNFEFINAGREHSVVGIALTYGMRLTPVSSIFIDVERKEFDYDQELRTISTLLDGHQTRAELGIEWGITRQTTGRFSLGVTDKEIDQTGRSSSSVSWQGELLWQPSKRDSLQFNTQRMPQESNGVGDFVNAQNTTVAWTRKLSHAMSLNASAGYNNLEFENDVREDDAVTFGVGIDYDLAKNLSIGLSYSLEDRDSNQSRFDYDRNEIKAALFYGF